MSLSVSFDHLSKTILKGKSDAALLLGITWEELQDTDRVTRLVVLTDPPVPGAPVLQLFLHDITRLTVKDHGCIVEHVRPTELNIHRVLPRSSPLPRPRGGQHAPLRWVCREAPADHAAPLTRKTHPCPHERCGA